MANDNNSVLIPKQWLMQNLQLVLREYWSSITAVFATKHEVASIAGADLTFADDEDAEAIWDDYTFSTTD